MQPARITAAALLVLFAALCVGSIAQQSVTGDEVAHLPAGYTYVKTGDFRLNPQHPPLIKALAGIPLLFVDLKPIETGPGWNEKDEWTFGRDFLTNNRTPTATIVFLARIPPMLVGGLLCLFVYLWGRELWGEWAGVFVLALCVFCPNVLAHSPLVTTDIGLAAFSTQSLYSLWRYSRSGRIADVIWSAVGLALALLAKYSAVITIGALAALLPIAWLRRREVDRRAPRADPFGPIPAPRASVAFLVAAASLFAVIPAALIAVGFGFPHGLETYLGGFKIIHADLNPYWKGFLWGEYERNGFWYYYLLGQWWKTPLPTLLLFFFGLFLVPIPFVRRQPPSPTGTASEVSGGETPSKHTRSSEDWQRVVDWLFLLVPLAAFHGAGLLYKSSIGVRHVLPAFPFVFLIAGSAVPWLRERGRAPAVIFAALCVWLVVGTLRMYPHFIPFFNELAGGPNNGIAYMDDSNIEWGQDLDNLKRYIDRNHIERVRLSAFKAYRPERFGITYEFMGLRDVVWPTEGITYFTGASYLQRNSLYNEYPGVRFEWLDRYEPADRIGWSIFVYRFSTSEADRDKPGVVYVPRERWYADAVDQLTRILEQSPKFADARQTLSAVYADRAAWRERGDDGKAEEALVDWFRAVRTDPTNVDARRGYRTAATRFLAAANEPARPVSEFYLRAFVADQEQHTDKALVDYLRCLRQAPDHLGALYNLGNLYVRTGFTELGANLWQKCIEVSPGYPPAVQGLTRLRQIAEQQRGAR